MSGYATQIIALDLGIQTRRIRALPRGHLHRFGVIADDAAAQVAMSGERRGQYASRGHLARDRRAGVPTGGSA